VTAFALAVVLLAELDEAEAPRERRFLVSASALTVLSVRGFGTVPLGLRTEFGYEVFGFLRLLAIGSLDGLDEGKVDDNACGIVGPFSVSAMVGAEGIVVPALPIELSAGVAGGITALNLCGSDYGGALGTKWRLQARLSIGYRFTDWLVGGITSSFNVVEADPPFSGTRVSPWFDFGARLSVRL
jgi:hypothetical protein